MTWPRYLAGAVLLAVSGLAAGYRWQMRNEREHAEDWREVERWWRAYPDELRLPASA